MKRKISLLVLFITAFKFNCFCQQKPNRPNIIFILADDHAYQAISAYGSKFIKTPNIDKIARQGALMRSAFVTNSVCSPSRAVILTGRYSHLNGMKDNGTYFNGAQQTLPKIFKQYGYQTAIVGKWHLFSTPTGFDYWDILPDQGNYYHPRFINMGKDTMYNGYVTDIITNLALNWVEANKNKPFFLMLHHKAPHRNAMPPIKYLDKFNNVQFPLPYSFYDDYANKPGLQRQTITVKNDLDIRYDSKIPCDTCEVTKINAWAPGEYQKELSGLTPAERKIWDTAYQKKYEIFKTLHTKSEISRFQYQRYMEDYLRCVMSLDDNVGRVLKYLDSTGLAKNTIVVYMSDQGFYLGEHGLYDKRFMYEESFRTPMMIRYPAKIKPGLKLDQFVLNLDVAPTLLDMAGIKPPTDMQGESMKPLLTRQPLVKKWRDEIYYHYYELSFNLTAHYGIRTKRYALMHFYNPVDGWELYDLQNDPHEMTNVYFEPEYKQTIVYLKKHLTALQVKYGDEEKDFLKKK
ncbi:sulfatase [Mucilaginibacter panaciglaebae]|uniref:Sulfatase n=1 Tax=Mucilaginibacter panaciglaebae TaxID=502331 RepID=A0ABP7WY58_9SPHI